MSGVWHARALVKTEYMDRFFTFSTIYILFGCIYAVCATSDIYTSNVFSLWVSSPLYAVAKRRSQCGRRQGSYARRGRPGRPSGRPRCGRSCGCWGTCRCCQHVCDFWLGRCCCLVVIMAHISASSFLPTCGRFGRRRLDFPRCWVVERLLRRILITSNLGWVASSN